MRILIVTTVQNSETQGNRITAERWSGLLSKLGHQTTIVSDWDSVVGDFDCLIALHATRNRDNVCKFRERYPDAAVLVALTGTDLHVDLIGEGDARRQATDSLELADRIIVLEPAAADRLNDQFRKKAVVILQSAAAVTQPLPIGTGTDRFVIAVVGHLRPVKDPFAAAEAARRLPAESKIEVVQWGAALEPVMAARAKDEMESNSRYRWLGELEHQQSLRMLAAADVMVISSVSEGGPAVISEAIVNGVPVIAHRFIAAVGLLGEEYPGFYQDQDREQLSQLMLRSEHDPEFLSRLKRCIQKLQPRFSQAAELAAWRQLLSDIALEENIGD